MGLNVIVLALLVPAVVAAMRLFNQMDLDFAAAHESVVGTQRRSLSRPCPLRFHNRLKHFDAHDPDRTPMGRLDHRFKRESNGERDRVNQRGTADCSQVVHRLVAYRQQLGT
jgi:hypothetical protein